MSGISNDILAVLSTVEISGHNVKIVDQLDRMLYLAVNDVLVRIGGKWNRKAKAHVFSVEPAARLEAVMNSGQLDPKIKTGYFPTPEIIVKQMIELLELQQGNTTLEPSAGQGHIADFLPKDNLIVGEILPENRHVLQEKGYAIAIEDFLKSEGMKVDRIIMNPPFEKQADIEHIMKAISCLNNGGILVSVMSSGVLFRNNKKTQQFRDDVLDYAEIIPLPEGSFKESGTMVNTILVKIRKEAT